MLFIEIILAVFIIAGAMWNFHKRDELDERSEELDKYSIHLDERANRLAAEENSLRSLSQSFRREIQDFHNRGAYTATYTETDSDLLRYTNDALIAANAKKHLAKIIAQDIVKNFKLSVSNTEDGKKRFSYKFKIMNSDCKE